MICTRPCERGSPSSVRPIHVQLQGPRLMAAAITTQANVLATAVGPHLYWITSRAAGIAALVLASLSVCIGLLMGGGRTLKSHRAELRVTHEALSLATLAALAVHGLSLLGDGYLHPSLGDVAIPFLSGYM